MTKQKNNKTNKKPKNIKAKNKAGLILILPLAIFALLFIANLVSNIYFLSHTLPNTYVANFKIGNLNRLQLIDKLNDNFEQPKNISLIIKDQQVDLPLENFNFMYDYDKTVSNIFDTKVLKKSYLKLLIPTNILSKIEFPLHVSIDETALEEYISILSSKYTTDQIEYSVKVIDQNLITNAGAPGTTINTVEVKEQITNSLANYNINIPITININQVDNTATEEEMSDLKNRATKLVGKKVEITHEYNTITVNHDKFIEFLGKNDSFKNEIVEKYITDFIAPKIERDPQNAILIVNDGKIEEFVPAKSGIKIKMTEFIQLITNSIIDLESGDNKSVSITIPVENSEPDITLKDVNNLGITELIGSGQSYFRGSISSRVFNIGHAAKKFKSILVKPGEVFSFNSILGDVSALTGYKQAYVIQNGRTVLGDGGGVCQVSTTLFRAVLNTGLPVIERRAHSYRVGYYEQGSSVGLDATVYYPTTDFKFKNDTNNHILLQSIFDLENSTLIFEIYGTSDGRVVTISKPIIRSSIPPPEDLYVDDPTLPVGQIKQVDYKAWGANVSFNYKVERSGEEIINKDFISNYRPWQSVFMRGTRL